MKLKQYHVLGVILLVAAGGLGREAKRTPAPWPETIAQHRKSFLEGTLFAVRQREAMLAKPPVGFNTKDVFAGIESVEIVVEDLPPVAEEHGLVKKDLRASIESQLREHRIKVISPPPVKAAPAEADQEPEQLEEPNETLMQLANAESDESFRQNVKDYLQQSEPVSSSGILDVTVSAVADETAGFAAYSVHVQFLQPVQLLRPDPARALAATWAVGKVGYVSLKEFSSIGGQAREIVDAFIDDYFEANPDKAPRALRETRTPPKGMVTGIVRSKDSSTAVIGTQVVREGESIDGVTIIKIYDDTVEFEKAGQRWTQKLNQPPGEQWK